MLTITIQVNALPGAAQSVKESLPCGWRDTGMPGWSPLPETGRSK